MPGVEHTGNSEITALVTSDPAKADELGKKYNVEALFSYEQFPEALSSGSFDAIYLATPNWRRAEFIVPSLKAGIHVLTEKPLEVSTAKCKDILEAEAASNVNSWSPTDFIWSRRHSIPSIKFDRSPRGSPSLRVDIFSIGRS